MYANMDLATKMMSVENNDENSDTDKKPQAKMANYIENLEPILDNSNILFGSDGQIMDISRNIHLANAV